MCKIVYLTSKRFDHTSNDFKRALATELRRRHVEVVVDCAYDFLNCLRSQKTYGIALAFDFYRDNKEGCGLTLNKNCSFISRDFAYNLSNVYDLLTPLLLWRDFKFVNSDDKQWRKFFHGIHSSTKAIFYLCTYTNTADLENFLVAFERIVQLFADEIVRCLRSNYDIRDYRKRVKLAKLKVNKVIEEKNYELVNN